MAKPVTFYGTPLSKSLQRNPPDRDDGPINRRRARLNEQQTVRDEQGRQRFHGAFTGGFSAGYYNSVDTIQGFKPRQFTSNRVNKDKDGSSSKFTHCPEDYMDEEDLGEFGIAPRKLRVNLQYGNNQAGQSFTRLSSGQDPTTRRLFISDASTLGEQILRRIRGNRAARYIKVNFNFTPKNDYHGLGYKPLSISGALSSEAKHINPLTAVLKSGKRLKISGEAFGEGVLEDDEDFLRTYNPYAYDDEGNYDIERKSSTKANKDNKRSRNLDSATDQDIYLPNYDIPAGFVLAGEMEVYTDVASKYPMPKIPDDWKMPVREEPYIAPVDKAQNAKISSLMSDQSSRSFDRKFTSSKGLLKSDDGIETRAGLVTYSDLKAVESKVVATKTHLEGEELDTEASVARVELEWRPCSLLCKHFNVPNPYPDNKFVGVRPANTMIERSEVEDLDINSDPSVIEIPERASMELKRSIFNVEFAYTQNLFEDIVTATALPDIDSDDPQIVELSDSGDTANKDLPDHVDGCDTDDDDQDIITLTIPAREPEVIVLSSSSSPSTSDTYGPPLPPPAPPADSSAAQPVDSMLRRSELRHRYRRKKRKHKK